MKIKVISSILILSSIFLSSILLGQRVSEPFEFRFEDKTLRGLIEKPQTATSTAIVILIPGYGKTDFVEGGWFSTLRDHLVQSGLTVVLWDKMGCGNSEGTFDAQQPVANSALEAIAAIDEIKRLQIIGSDKIGLWGISRAGWICPLINEQFPIDFWISVSGTDDKENFGYLLRENLIIAGKGEAESERLFEAWMQGHKVMCTQGSYEDFLSAIQPLREDSICQKLFAYTNQAEITDEGRERYLRDQKTYTSRGYFDEESGLWVYLENFEQLLQKLDCPVLALFGENDSQVDWRKTKSLYEQTITASQNAQLSTKVFSQCNHSLQKCVSCAYQEDLSALKWQACNNYYETITDWLKNQQIIE